MGGFIGTVGPAALYGSIAGVGLECVTKLKFKGKLFGASLITAIAVSAITSLASMGAVVGFSIGIFLVSITPPESRNKVLKIATLVLTLVQLIFIVVFRDTILPS